MSSEANTSVSLKSVSLVTVFSVGQLIVLFLLHLLLAKFFGASPDLDVYMAVFAIPLLLSGVLSGSLSSVLIPMAHEIQSSETGDRVEAFLHGLGRILAIGSLVLALLLFIASEPVVRLLYAGFDESQIRLGGDLMRILAWLIPLNVITSYLFGVFHARGSFLWPAISGLTGPLVTVVSVASLPDPSVQKLAWAVVAGGIVGAGFLLPGFPRPKNLEPAARRRLLRRFVVLLAPLIFGAAFMRLDPIVDRHLAAGLSEGSISHLGYAWRLVSSVSVLATSGLSVVAFPALARHAAAGDREKFAAEMAHGFRFLVVVLVPMIGGLLLFSDPIIAWLLERGEFTPADTAAVARLIRLYTGVIFAAAIGEISARAFFALGKTWTPTLIGISWFVLGSAAKFFCVDRFEVDALAFLTSTYFVFTNIFFLFALWQLVRRSMFAGLGGALFRAAACSALALAGVAPMLSGGQGWRVPAGILTSVVGYVALLAVCRDEFTLRLWHGAKRFLRRDDSTGDSVIG